MSTRTDMHHGRQGGNWLPDDYEPVNLLTARPCDVCGEPMVAGQFRRHHLCDRSTIVGLQCTCPPACTREVVGDAGTCDPVCEVCTMLAGTTHAEVSAWKRSGRKK